MRTPVLFTAVAIALGSTCIAESRYDIRKLSGVTVIEPDRSKITQIRQEFEKLKDIHATYTTTPEDNIGGAYWLGRPDYLKITLNPEADRFVKAYVGVEGEIIPGEFIFALWPYLNSKRDRDAFVLLMAFTSHGYLHRTKLGPELPLARGSSDSAWLSHRDALLGEVREACKFVLHSGAKSLAQCGYDVAPLVAEKVLSPDLVAETSIISDQSVPAPTTNPVLPVTPEPLPPAQQPVIAPTAQEKGISWWAIGGGFVFVLSAGVWLLRFTKKSGK